MLQLNEAEPVPYLETLEESVGLGVVAQHIPFSVIDAPPDDDIVPVPPAPELVIDEAVEICTTGGDTSFWQDIAKIIAIIGIIE